MVDVESRGMRISSDIAFQGGKMISVVGPMRVVLAYAKAQKWKSSHIIMLGQNGSVVSKHKPDRVFLHMLVVSESEWDIACTRGFISVSLLGTLRQEGFDYAHLIASLEFGVRISVFGSDFAKNPHAETVLQAISDAFFEPSGRMRINETETNVMLLIGRAGGRVMAGLIHNCSGTFRLLSNLFALHVETRHAVVGKNIFLCASHDRKKVGGVTSRDILAFLNSVGFGGFLPWTYIQVKQTIDDIAVIDGTNDLVILTFKNGMYRLVPFIVRFTVHGKMELIQSVVEGVRREDLEGGLTSSLVRITKDLRLILADRQSTELVVRFDDALYFGSKFHDMLARALVAPCVNNHPMFEIF